MKLKTLCLSLLPLLSLPALSRDVAFEKITLTREFLAEGCAIADFNKDGHMDLTAGCYIWFGPDFKRRETFTPPSQNPSGPAKTPYDPAKGYSDYFLSYAYDFNGDSWPDILVYGFPGEAANVFVNPKGPSGDWQKVAIFDIADGESPDLKDVNGDGKPELLAHSSDANKPPEAKGKGGGQLGFAEIDWKNPLGKARFRPITPKTKENDEKYFRYTHGYGAGDLNGDGRSDILSKDGWFEQPADLSVDSNWTFHPTPFAGEKDRGGSFMLVYDVNADGRNDVITGHNAHGFGLYWYEQLKNGSFHPHKIMGATPEENPHGVKFSQLHSMLLADLNGDGVLDLVTGKRRWAHGPFKDDEPEADPVLYWFEIRRDGKGHAEFIPHLIDNDSGVGTQVSSGDINSDGKIDVAVANKSGVFLFRQK